MLTNNGGYQFMRPVDYMHLETADMQYLQSDMTEFHIRYDHRDEDRQKYGLFTQLNEYA